MNFLEAVIGADQLILAEDFCKALTENEKNALFEIADRILSKKTIGNILDRRQKKAVISTESKVFSKHHKNNTKSLLKYSQNTLISRRKYDII